MKAALWKHEARRCGPAALALPVLAAAGILAMSFAIQSGPAGGTGTAGTGLVRLVADAFPVAAGLAVAAAIGRERLIELQLTVLTEYRRTVGRRLSVVCAVVVLAAGLLVLELIATGQWHHPAQGPAALLVPLGPAALLAGAGTWASVALRSTAGASTVVVGVWLLQVLILDRYVSSWQLNRGLLIIAGAVLLVLAMGRLRNSERLLQEGAE
jgi:hypothetical protein